MLNYYEKYIKYKQKYLTLKNQKGNGENISDINQTILEQIDNDSLLEI